LAGQTAAGPDGEIVGRGDIVKQFEQTLKNLETVVGAHGGKLTDIVKLQMLVTNKDLYQAHLKAIGDLYRKFFGKYYPTITFWETPLFQEGAMIEIDGWAVLDVERFDG
jgi:enamine deaminase RidA (YjgF/YER057c/UK114 family)